MRNLIIPLLASSAALAACARSRIDKNMNGRIDSDEWVWWPM